MKCIHINVRQATFILLSVLANNVRHTEMAANEMDYASKDEIRKNSSSREANSLRSHPLEAILPCSMREECNKLTPPCIDCFTPTNCIYGHPVNVTCQVKHDVACRGDKEKNFTREMICQYCYQTEPWQHTCDLKANCNSVASPRAHYKTNCTVNNDILCLGHRTFMKNVHCNWTGGYRWSSALILSITLGGFGADRFYLGHWQEGIGKLFSFGGLGVWTLIDVILISLHYLGPADGSLYI